MAEMKLKLERPLVFFDLETTGTNIMEDRIVEICILKLFPDGHTEEVNYRVNPGKEIPEEATAVHHITNEMVADKPLFKDIAAAIAALFDKSDIAGYNSNKFDVPLLIEEFDRAAVPFAIGDHRFVDVQNIFHKMEQRTLVAAYKFYCGKDLENAHSATSDTSATMEVLMSQLERYPSLENNVEYLSEFSKGSNNIDLTGRFIYDKEKRPVVNFGKHKGKLLKDVLRIEPSYFSWIMQGKFPKVTKDALMGLKIELEKGS